MSVNSVVKLSTVTFLALSLISCGDSDNAKKPMVAAKAKAMPVETMIIKTERIKLVEDMPGRTIAFRKTEVRPQVDGIIQKRMFEEGAYVQEGDPLYTIDSGVYQATLDATKADLARVQATLSQAVKTMNRYKLLVKRQAVSQQKYDDAVSELAQAKAAVAAARAQVDQAEINMEHTIVKARISGQIGSSAVNEGSLVTASQTTLLTTITQLDPIYVDVTQAGGRLLKIKHAIKSGVLQGAAPDKVEVSLLIDATGTDYAHKGTLKFSDVSVNETTGTVRLRAIFPNPNRDLLPGMFVHGRVYQGELENAFLVPQKATMRRPDGSAFVYVIENGKVSSKEIKIEQASGQNWVVTSGVKVGDALILDGLQRVGPGSDVVDQATLSAPKTAK